MFQVSMDDCFWKEILPALLSLGGYLGNTGTSAAPAPAPVAAAAAPVEDMLYVPVIVCVGMNV